MTGDTGNNGWRDYQKLVLNELRRLDENVEKLGDRVDIALKHERGNRQVVENATQADLQRLALDVNTLKLKCGVYGLVGGLLPVCTALILKQL